MHTVEDVEVAVVGAGQAGLSVSHELTAVGVEHVVLERDRVASAWRDRWDSFRLVTPNHTIRLPGGEYHGDDPHGFLGRDEMVGHLERYAASLSGPVRTGVDVVSLHREPAGAWRLETASGSMRARAVVVATGAYQRAHEPAAVLDLQRRLPVVDSSAYRNPDALPPGAVLVAGSGQTGCQIAEELVTAGRRVVLACGRAPWIERRIAGRDVVDWVIETGFLDEPRDILAGPDALLVANVQATGVDGGHDLHYRTLAALGVQLAGHLVGSDGLRAVFADDLAASVAFGDARRAELSALIVAAGAAKGISVPPLPDPPPFDQAGLADVPVAELGSVVLACGYRPAYRGLVRHPAAFDAAGFPRQRDGASTVLPGLFFVGAHFLRRRKSSLLLGVGEDATVVAQQVAEGLR
jgi:putative flavoprotein involved in K+ transport